MSNIFELLEEKEKGTSVEVLVKLIMELIELERFTEALTYLEELELFDEALYLYYYLNGLICERNERLEEALKNYEKSLSYVEFYEGLFALANIYDKLDLIQDAIDTYNYMLANDYYPRDILYINLSAILEENNLNLEAIELLNEALEEGIIDASIYYNLGVNYMKLAKYTEAINYYNEALKFDDYDDYLLFNLGVCYKDSAMYEEALEYYKRSLKEKQVIPDYTLYNIACVYALKEDLTDTLAYLKKAFELNPNLISFALTDEELINNEEILNYLKSASK